MSTTTQLNVKKEKYDSVCHGKHGGDWNYTQTHIQNPQILGVINNPCLSCSFPFGLHHTLPCYFTTFSLLDLHVYVDRRHTDPGLGEICASKCGV